MQIYKYFFNSQHFIIIPKKIIIYYGFINEIFKSVLCSFFSLLPILQRYRQKCPNYAFVFLFVVIGVNDTLYEYFTVGDAVCQCVFEEFADAVAVGLAVYGVVAVNEPAEESVGAVVGVVLCKSLYGISIKGICGTLLAVRGLKFEVVSDTNLLNSVFG
ncbi:MAG: hypothetical protein IJK99_08060 [Bacteroidales bacterium]|nr:hypothetical protein [Bacteroidales bacterium]